ncbi:MAG TPA: hypothetical protein VGV35_19915, partial [Bryobacteraceae bacterium]|nr:hypothetical protein [Bryobacteraceae bacterium]
EFHLSVLFAKQGRVDEALKYFAAVSSRSNFDRLDSVEARRELVKILGGESQLDSRIQELVKPVAATGSTARVIALVDANGKVLDAQPADPKTPVTLVEEAKSLKLPSLSWPDHSFRSIRTIVFRPEGSKWSLSQSYVGQPSGPSTTP